VKATAAAGDLVRRPDRGLVVLIYHRVGRRTSIEVDLPLDLFERQLELLVEECNVVTLEDGLREVAQPDGAGTRPTVAVTFDDGTDDFGELVVPVLERTGVPATLYAATSFIDEGIEYPDGGRPVTWQALRDAVSTGLVSVGSHTHHHALLDRLPAGEIADELDRSIDLIGEQVGARPLDFAYPKAVLGSHDAEDAVRERFRSAAVAGSRANVPGATDPYHLLRTPVQVSDGMRWFRRKVRGGLGFEDTLRRTLNRRRYAGATT
jgi:peptidoglycan/xylan/chitin deacetylase (PgdA/CDA1 family)